MSVEQENPESEILDTEINDNENRDNDILDTENRDSKIPGILLPDCLSKKWTITEVLGSGTGGTVFRARGKDGEECAIKMIHSAHEQPDQELLDTLQECSGFVRIYETVREGGRLFVRMELLKSFEALTQEKKLSEVEVITGLSSLLSTLSFCEAHHILHRDIKPANILVRDNGELVLCDLEQLRYEEEELSIQGTFAYMAPEIYQGHPYDHRADLYSLGMVFYRLLNRGRGPFLPLDKKYVNDSDRDQGLIRRMRGERVEPPCEASEGLRIVFSRLLEYDPKDRYQSAEECLRDLQAVRDGEYVLKQSGSSRAERRKRPVILCAVCAVILLAVMSGLWYYAHMPIVRSALWEPGSEIYYTITRDGTVIFSGEGELEVNPENLSFFEQRNTYRKAIIKSGITVVGRVFSDCSNLETVRIEEGVRELGEGAFSLCPKLRSVLLPDSLTAIGDQAFFLCGSLEEISIPEAVAYLGIACFSNSGLTDVKVPKQARVRWGAFSETPWYREVLEKDHYVAINGILLDYETDEETVTFPEVFGLTEIAGFSLLKLANAETIVIPEGVTRLDESCCQGLTNLKKVVMPDSVKEIGTEAFSGTGLCEISLPEGVDLSEGEMFAGTPYLDSLMDEHGFAIIGDILMAYQGNDERIEIPSGISIIGRSAFRMNPVIKEVVIPDSVERIGSAAFFGCQNLEKVEFPDHEIEMDPSSFGMTKIQIPGY